MDLKHRVKPPSACTIAGVQKAGSVAAFVDVEHALDPSRAEKSALIWKFVDLAAGLRRASPEITETLIRSGGVDIVVVDSVAALVPKAEIEGEMGDTQMGMQARLMSQAMRKLTSRSARPIPWLSLPTKFATR